MSTSKHAALLLDYLSKGFRLYYTPLFSVWVRVNPMANAPFTSLYSPKPRRMRAQHYISTQGSLDGAIHRLDRISS